MTAQSKAERACMAYAQNAAMISQLGLEIGRQLEQCKGVLGTLHRWSHQHPHEHSQDETHLTAYFMAVRGAGGSGGVKDARQQMESCPHCKRAHQLVQDRKTFRQRLGAAKRLIIEADKLIRAEHGMPTAKDEVIGLIKASEVAG
jgi:glutaredoxin